MKSVFIRAQVALVGLASSVGIDVGYQMPPDPGLQGNEELWRGLSKFSTRNTGVAKSKRASRRRRAQR